jgi:ketosteroid isomerase-like protein
MSQENVNALKRALDAAPEHAELFLHLLDEDIEWDLTGLEGARVGLVPNRLRGRAAVRDFFRTWADTFEEWDYEAEEVIDAGASVFVCLHQRVRGRGSGVPVENRLFQVWTFENGKVIRHRAFNDRVAALEAAGLKE